MSSRTWSRRVHVGVEGAASQTFLPTIEEIDEEGNEESASVCDGGGSTILPEKMKDGGVEKYK